MEEREEALSSKVVTETVMADRARLLGFALSRAGGDAALAEDALMEAVCRALQRGGFTSIDGCRRWLLTVIRTVLLDVGKSAEVRRRGRWDGPDDPVSVEPQPEAVYEQRELAATVSLAMTGLSEVDRTLLWLRDALGASVPVAAATAGVTPGSARVMLVRARRRLAARLTGALAWIVAWASRRRHQTRLPQISVAAAVALPILVGALPPSLVSEPIDGVRRQLLPGGLDERDIATIPATSGGAPNTMPPLPSGLASLPSAADAGSEVSDSIVETPLASVTVHERPRSSEPVVLRVGVAVHVAGRDVGNGATYRSDRVPVQGVCVDLVVTDDPGVDSRC